MPNATVMLIENAERFGLAQLHQLRGRIGRGEHKSYCILLRSDPSKETMAKLAVLGENEQRLRGGGSRLGIARSGRSARNGAKRIAGTETGEPAVGRKANAAGSGCCDQDLP